MERTYASNWWAVALRGVIGIIVGIVAFVWPGVTMTALALLFGAFALLDGIFNFASAFRGMEKGTRWWPALLEGIVGVLAAVATALWPGITILALVYVIGAWAFLTGILEIAAAVRLRKYISGEWLLGLAGAASIVFGILLWIAPITGALVLTWWVGVYAFIFGGVLLALAFKLRRWSHTGQISEAQLPA